MIEVYDFDGNKMDLIWALDTYNVKLTIVAKSRDHWEVVELREVIGPHSMTVRIKGAPNADIPVAFYWPPGEDGDIGTQKSTFPGEPYPHAIKQQTDRNGQTGFGMGPGAYYRPDKEEQGPHAVWISDYPECTSDLVDGLGMIGKTNHTHLEPTFQFVKGETEPPAPPDCEEYHIAIEKIREIMEGLRDEDPL